MKTNGMPTRAGDILKLLGFKPESAESTGHALILSLIRSTYGEAAAQSAARELLLLRNRTNLNPADQSRDSDEFTVTSDGSEPVQLSLFDRKLG